MSKTVIRNGMFETNSSSVHSICISKKPVGNVKGKKIWGSENMNEMIKTILEQSKENYTNAAEVSLKVISKQSLLTDTEKLLGTLIQVEITNGCILAEILSLLNTLKDGDTNG